MYLDLGRDMDNRICMVLEWTPEEARIDFLCCSVSLHLKGTWETQNHQTYCMRPVLVSSIYSCMFIIIDNPESETINLSLLHLKIASDTQSKPPVTGYPRTKEQES